MKKEISKAWPTSLVNKKIIFLLIILIVFILLNWPKKCRNEVVCPMCPAYRVVCNPWWKGLLK